MQGNGVSAQRDPIDESLDTSGDVSHFGDSTDDSQEQLEQEGYAQCHVSLPDLSPRMALLQVDEALSTSDDLDIQNFHLTNPESILNEQSLDQSPDSLFGDTPCMSNFSPDDVIGQQQLQLQMQLQSPDVLLHGANLQTFGTQQTPELYQQFQALQRQQLQVQQLHQLQLNSSQALTQEQLFQIQRQFQFQQYQLQQVQQAAQQSPESHCGTQPVKLEVKLEEEDNSEQSTESHLHKKQRQSQQQMASPPKHPVLNKQQLSTYFHMPITDAAKQLGVCTTMLKKVCRRNGIPRWPYRKIKSLDAMIASLQLQLEKNPADTISILHELAVLANKREHIMQNPEVLVHNKSLVAHKRPAERKFISATPAKIERISQVPPYRVSSSPQAQPVISTPLPVLMPAGPCLPAPFSTAVSTALSSDSGVIQQAPQSPQLQQSSPLSPSQMAFQMPPPTQSFSPSSPTEVPGSSSELPVPTPSQPQLSSPELPSPVLQPLQTAPQTESQHAQTPLVPVGKDQYSDALSSQYLSPQEAQLQIQSQELSQSSTDSFQVQHKLQHKQQQKHHTHHHHRHQALPDTSPTFSASSSPVESIAYPGVGSLTAFKAHTMPQIGSLYQYFNNMYANPVKIPPVMVVPSISGAQQAAASAAAATVAAVGAIGVVQHAQNLVAMQPQQLAPQQQMLEQQKLQLQMQMQWQLQMQMQLQMQLQQLQQQALTDPTAALHFQQLQVQAILQQQQEQMQLYPMQQTQDQMGQAACVENCVASSCQGIGTCTDGDTSAELSCDISGQVPGELATDLGDSSYLSGVIAPGAVEVDPSGCTTGLTAVTVVKCEEHIPPPQPPALKQEVPVTPASSADTLSQVKLLQAQPDPVIPREGTVEIPPPLTINLLDGSGGCSQLGLPPLGQGGVLGCGVPSEVVGVKAD